MSALHRAQGFAGARRRTRLHPIGATLLTACLATSAWATEPSVAYTVQPGDRLIVLAKEMLVHPGAPGLRSRASAPCPPPMSSTRPRA